MHRRHVHKASVCSCGIKAHTFGDILRVMREVHCQIHKRHRQKNKLKLEEIYRMYNYYRVSERKWHNFGKYRILY